MPFLDTGRQRAAWLILLLGAGLAIAVAPYATGLVGGLVLYVVFRPLHGPVARGIGPRPAAIVVVILALVLLVAPTVFLATLLVDQAQAIASGVIQSPLLQRLATLEIRGMPVGPRLAGAGERIVTWLGTNALGLIGTATRIALNIAISLFLTYYLLLKPGETWAAMKPYIPFSEANAERLRERFRDVTISTIVGTGLIAVVQGSVVALGFQLTDLDHPLFWGVVTVVFAILPIVGSGLIWGPGALTLVLDGRYGAAAFLATLGVVVVGNVDLLIRPAVFRRYAQIHPLVTLIGAIGGVSYFGLLGILIGPLAVSYFFELIRMYREEYLPR